MIVVLLTIMKTFEIVTLEDILEASETTPYGLSR